MSSEIPFLGGRSEAAERMMTPIGLNPYGFSPVLKYPDLPQGQLILDAINQQSYTSRPLGDLVSNDNTDIPRAWRFLGPVANTPAALTTLDFGMVTTDIEGSDKAGSIANHTEYMNANLRAVHESIPAVQGLFKMVGADVAKEVSKSGHHFFAGLERRFDISDMTEGASVVTFWNQLVYSKRLETTGQFIAKALQRGARLPAWAHKASQPKNAKQTAHLMALSALSANIK